MVGVGAGAGAGAGTGAGTGAVFGVGAGAAAFAVNTGENCGGPVFFDGFVFCRGALAPAALSFRKRSCRAGEPLILVDGMGSKVSCLPWLPEARHALFWCRFQRRRAILVRL